MCLLFSDAATAHNEAITTKEVVDDRASKQPDEDRHDTTKAKAATTEQPDEDRHDTTKAKAASNGVTDGVVEGVGCNVVSSAVADTSNGNSGG